MSVTPRGVCLLSVLVLCAVAVLAVAPCDQNIIRKLRTSKHCYKDHVPPNQEIPGAAHTHLLTSNVDVPKGNAEEGYASCMKSHRTSDTNFTITYQFSHFVKGWDKDQGGHIEYYAKRYTETSFERTIKDDHVLETDSNGVTYKLYVIHNIFNVYSYYRCIHSGPWKGNGRPQVEAAMSCHTAGMSLNARIPPMERIMAEEVMGQARLCIKHLGVTYNAASLDKCFC